ncbi:TrbC/VirB2 family protein [Streptomyces sp. DSM 3412]|uniref:TrbC/VirB2 family protein n=2 Tax=Streptomyces TaxID=1883 RepID=A0ABU2Z939_9ACTN|nr:MULTISPECIES: TrbC/VirB2 family protein [unclassified Streptomyces]MDT0573110.1 TrbC/VirB2 family protein [Streptomyces sp. DSM 3412]UUU32213.1 TrbC/VirB2 family protein [Streptomyces sp. CA-210063]
MYLAATLDSMFGEIQDILTNAGTMVAVIALLVLGIRMLLSMKRGDGMREAFQGFGMIALAALIIGGASGLAGVLIDLGSQIGGGEGGQGN